MGMEFNEQRAATECIHALVLPFPSQGHVTPLMQLAKTLAGLGLHITFVNTSHIQKRILKSNSASELICEPEIQMVEISDGLPDTHPRLEDLSSFSEALEKMVPEFENLFGRLVLESHIACVICDVSMLRFVHGITEKMGIPVAAFATSSAIAFHCMYGVPTFLAAGILPLPAPSDSSVLSINPKTLSLRPPETDTAAEAQNAPLPDSFLGASREMRVKDLPTVILLSDPDHIFFHYILEYLVPAIPSCSCLLLNTFYDLEADAIDAMLNHANSHIYAIGPLAYTPRLLSADKNKDMSGEPSLAGVGSSLWEEDHKALLWLESQTPKSVLYVSFGSMAQASVSQLLQLAYGLEESNKKFLWVIRPNEVANFACCNEFSEFSHRIQHRALLVSWVPQAAVLSHPSVGAFLTHCGWNSLIESISSGVPMLGLPIMSDQTTNCFYMAHVWKIGMELEFTDCEVSSEGMKERIVKKEEVEKKVKKLMLEDHADPEIDSMRKRCKQLQDRAKNAVMKGGSSYKALMDFLNHITSSKSARHI